MDMEAPFISCGASLPSRAFVANSLISLDTANTDLRSACLITGTSKPLSVSAAIPML